MDITSKLDSIIEKLDILETKIDKIDTELHKVSKHVGFVDALAESGVVGAVRTLNEVLNCVNPMKLVGSKQPKLK